MPEAQAFYLRPRLWVRSKAGFHMYLCDQCFLPAAWVTGALAGLGVTLPSVRWMHIVYKKPMCHTLNEVFLRIKEGQHLPYVGL